MIAVHRGAAVLFPCPREEEGRRTGRELGRGAVQYSCGNIVNFGDDAAAKC